MCSPLLKQVAAALVCAQTFVVLGVSVGVGSVLFLQETTRNETAASNSTQHLTLEQTTWAVSSFTFGNIPGCVASAYLLPWLGTPRLLISSLPLAAGGAAMVAFSTRFEWAFAGRLLIGLYFGITEGAARSYVGEITGKTVRSVISSLLNLVTPLMSMVVLVLGPSLPWRTIEAALVIPSVVLQATCVLFLPQSPKWLLARGGTREEAEKSVRFFMGPDADVQQEVKQIQDSLSSGSSGEAALGARAKLWLLISRWQNLKPALLLLLQFFCMVYSGGMAIGQYAPAVFHSTGQRSDPYRNSLYIMGAVALSFLASGPILEKFSRVRLLQVAGLSGAVGCGAMGAYFWLDRHAWLVLAGALVTMVSYGAVIAPASFTYLVELLPNSVRACAINLVLLYFSVLQFLTVHLFPAMTRGLGSAGALWLFAMVNLLQVALATFLLPETRSLSLEEIQTQFFEPKPEPMQIPVPSGGQRKTSSSERRISDVSVEITAL